MKNADLLSLKEEKISVFTKLLSIYFALMVCDIFSIGGAGTILKFYAIGLLIVGLVYLLKARIILDKVLLLEILYLIICLISIIYSIGTKASISAFITLLMNFGLIILCQNIVFTKAEVQYLQHSLVIGGVIILCASLFFADFSDAGRLAIKILGDSADQNYLNGYLLFAFSYFLNNLLVKKKVKISCLMVIGMLLFSLATGSRGALFALIAIVITLLFIVMKKHIGKIFLWGIFLYIAFNIVLNFLPEEVSIRFSLEYIQEHGTTHRSEIWKALIERFFNDDLFSIMFGKGVYASRYYNTYVEDVAHNLFLEIMIGTGIVGLSIYLGLLVAIFKRAWVSKNYIMFASLVGLITLSMSLSLIVYKPIFNAFIVIDIAFKTYRKNKKGEKENA